MDVNLREIVSRETSRAMDQREVSPKNSRGEFTASQKLSHLNSRVRLNCHSRVGLLENILIIFCGILKILNYFKYM